MSSDFIICEKEYVLDKCRRKKTLNFSNCLLKAMGILWILINVKLCALKELLNCIWLSFRFRVEDQCTKGIFLMFRVKGKNNFWRHFSTEFFFVRKRPTNFFQEVYFLGFIPFHCLISYKVFCFNALKIRLSFIKKQNKLKNWEI